MQTLPSVTYDQHAQLNAPLPKRLHSLDKFHGFSVESKPATFTKEEFIGSGCFGSVFKAKTIDGRQVAVKRISKDQLRYDCCLAEREKQNLEYISSLNYQHFIGYLGGYVIGANVQFVLELGDISLDKLLKLKLHEMNTHRFNNIAYQALGMVAFLDSIGMCHNDLYFANMVYFHSTDLIKLIDFERSTLPGDDDHESPFLDLGLLAGALFELQLSIKGYDKAYAMRKKIELSSTSNFDNFLRRDALWLDDLNEQSKYSIMAAGNIRNIFRKSPKAGETKGKEIVKGRECFSPRAHLPLTES